MSPQTQTTTNTLSTARKANNALQQVELINQTIFGYVDPATGQRVPGAFERLDRRMSNQAEQFSQLVEVVDAIVSKIGPEAIEEAISASRIERARADRARQEANLAQALTEGKLVEVSVVTDSCLIAGEETDATGKVVEPGWFLLHYTQLKPGAQESLLGKDKGFETTADNGNTFKVVGIYEVVPEKEAAAPAPATPDTTVSPNLV
jgi:hypothetical protein